jgi:peptidoglycan/LPS O-acetylase OafA/YrhL
MNIQVAATKPARAKIAGAKIAYVETVRGIASILLVSYHIIGDTSASGLHLPESHYFSFLNSMLIDVRMPLFSFISGFVFSAYAADILALRIKISAKVRRLLVPLAVVGSLHYCFQTIFHPPPEGQVPYYHLFILPYEHFWFLQATFILMLVVFLTTYWLKGDGVRAASILLVPCMIASVLLDRWHPDIFSGYKALYLAPYFLVGYLISHAATLRTGMDYVAGRRDLIVAAAIWLGVLFWFEVLVNEHALHLNAPEQRLLGLTVGLSTCLFFFMARFKLRFLVWIGDKSYAIFLFHVFFTAGSRIILEQLVPEVSVPVLFVAGLLAGIAGPMVISWAALKHPLSALLLLGVRAPATTKGGPPAIERWAFVIPSFRRRSDESSQPP